MFKPNSTAFFATNPAAIITLGLDVFVQLVIAAITISPDFIHYFFFHRDYHTNFFLKL